jgi:hypothetical protein
MAYTIRMFFRSSTPVSLLEITEIAKDGMYFDEDPRFDPDPNGENVDALNWTSLTIIWSAEKKPVLFRNHYQGDEIRQEIGRLTHILGISKKTKAGQRVTDHLREAVRMLAIEMNREEISDEAWAMLDAIEAHLAKKYDGIIFTQEGAFFDKDLKRFYRL